MGGGSGRGGAREKARREVRRVERGVVGGQCGDGRGQGGSGAYVFIHFLKCNVSKWFPHRAWQVYLDQ